MARFRFFSPDEIDGSGLTKGSSDSLVLQSLLQNTLEQFVLALAVYAAWCFLMPVSTLSAVPLCSLLFAIRRILFFKGYKSGAASRAAGFALTFYSSALLFLCLIVHEVWRLVSWVGAVSKLCLQLSLSSGELSFLLLTALTAINNLLPISLPFFSPRER